MGVRAYDECVWVQVCMNCVIRVQKDLDNWELVFSFYRGIQELNQVLRLAFVSLPAELLSDPTLLL